jgi:PAB1-binding protein PBP1
MEADIDILKWYQQSRKEAQSNRHMNTSKDLLTFDSLEPVTVQVTGMKKQDSEWKSNNEEHMKEMMASLKAISNQLNEAPTQLSPARSRENTALQTSSNNRNWSRNKSTCRQGSPESTRPRQNTETRRCFSI